VKFLSTRRRHPLAGLVVLGLGLLLMGGLYSALRPAAADDSTTDTALISQGRRLFVASCSSCHGLNGEGVLSKHDTNFGPPLIGVGAAAVDFQVSTGRMPAARPGTQMPAREPVYTDQEVRALSAYVASLGPGPAIPSADDYNIDGLTSQQIAEGGQFFRTNCTACHNYTGAGGTLPNGRYAVSLLGVDPRFIYEAMITGPQNMPQFSDDVLKPQEKREIIGYLHSLETQPGYGGSKLGGLGPVGEGLWGWAVGIGGLVLATVWISNNGARVKKKKSQ
jgi:quinol---cytochrome-c reductase cytochrome c subunit